MAVGDEGLSKNARGKVLLLAQEIEFAKVLAGNDKRLRDRGIKRLRKWLMARSNGKCELTDDDFLRIWKGIFYCMWMADKLLVQEELAETISSLVHCFEKTELAFSFIRCFFRTMVLEWYGIDVFRYDKFMMLVRRFLRQTFKFCRNRQWQEEVVAGVCNAFSVTVLSSSKPPLSLVMHFCDVYLQELAKVGKEKIPVEVVTAFLQPFITVLSVEENGIVRNKVVRDIFHYLMKQSDAALEFVEKWKAWNSAGCPGESWEDMERVEEEKEEEEMDCNDVEPSESEMLGNEPQDPRAGSVHVDLPQIPFDARGIAEAIQLQIEKCTSKKYSKALQYLEKKFIELAEGKYPLAKTEAKNVLMKPKVEKFKLKNHVNKAVFRLNNFEQKIDKRKRKRKSQKKLNKQEKVAEVEVTEDNDAKQAPVVPSPEKPSTVSLDSCVSEANDGSGSPLKSRTRKRRNGGSSLIAGDVANVEPKMKVKRKAEIVNEAKTDHNSTPQIKKRAASISWEVSDVTGGSSEAQSVEKSPILASGAIEVESVDQVGKTAADSNEQKVTTPSNIKGSKKAAAEQLSNKKVNIVLNKNCTQDLRQYQMSVRRSPAIPFDGNKQPSQGVLKPSPIGPRVNPFYRLRGKKTLGS